jgi:hypothetical protein
MQMPVENIRLIFAYTACMSRYDRPSHRVYMSFFFRGGWNVQFLEADLKTPLPRRFTFADPDKIKEMARRGEAWVHRKRGTCWSLLLSRDGEEST